MIRLLIFLALVTALALGAVWLAERPGEVVMTWSGLRIETTVAVAAIGVFGLVVLGMILWSLARFIMGLPTAFSFASRARKRARGIEAVSRGMVAIGAGDAAAARRHAADAQKLIAGEPLTLLLAAQSAQLNGDKPAAEAAFKAMLDEPDTRILGLRGLFVEARRRGDQASAFAFAEEAVRRAPSLAWANDALLEHHTAAGDWVQARVAVERRTSLRLADKTEARRHRAVLLAAEALNREAGDADQALGLALDAVKLAPGLTPAATLAAKLLGARGDLRKAAKIVEAAWREQPHPDLARIYLRLRQGDSAGDKLARAETLHKLKPVDPESAFVVAEAAILARNFTRAREVLSPLVAAVPTVRACLLMAAIEDGEFGSQGRGREWLKRSTRAPRDNAWIADGVVSETWLPVSPVSGRLDAFVWTLPPAALGAGLASPIELIEPESADPPKALALDAAREAPGKAPKKAVELEAPSAATSVASAPAPEPQAAPASAPAPAVVEEVAPMVAKPQPLVAAPMVAEPARPAAPAPEAAPTTASAASASVVVEAASGLPQRAPDDPGPEPEPKKAKRARWPFQS